MQMYSQKQIPRIEVFYKENQNHEAVNANTINQQNVNILCKKKALANSYQTKKNNFTRVNS